MNLRYKLKILFKVNWLATFYFNYKMLPFSQAKKLPVFFFGRVKFTDLSGSISINAPIRRAMITFGQSFELNTVSKGIGEIYLAGKIIFNGYMHSGKDCLLYVAKNATCQFGNMSALGSDVRVICWEGLTIGDWTGVGYQSQISDSNFHPMKDSKSNLAFATTKLVTLGGHNTISNRCTIMPGTTTPDNCMVASNSLCNSDYTVFGSNVLIGGIPAKLLRTNFTRDWEQEREALERYKIIRF